MTIPDMIIVALAILEVLALVAMGLAALLMYHRVKTVNGWVQPAMRESRAIAARGQATALESKERTLVFSRSVQSLVQHVKQKAQTTARLAREVVHPSLPLQQTARALTGPDGLTRRLARLREAGKIAAGHGDGSRRSA
jgi:hypothetical protein